MKILVTFPFFANPDVALASYNSFIDPDVDIYTIDDNAKEEVKAMIAENDIPIRVRNEHDRFATGCWNQAAAYFLKHPEYDVLRIGFSDVIMMDGWKDILEKQMVDNEAVLPYFTTNLLEAQEKRSETQEKIITMAGTPADCVFLSRKLVELVFPVPEEIKLWYNDEYIFTIYRTTGHPVVVLNDLRAYHYGSLIIEGPYAEGSHNQIEEDKRQWQEKIYPAMIEKIGQINESQQYY